MEELFVCLNCVNVYALAILELLQGSNSLSILEGQIADTGASMRLQDSLETLGSWVKVGEYRLLIKAVCIKISGGVILYVLVCTFTDPVPPVAISCLQPRLSQSKSFLKECGDRATVPVRLLRLEHELAVWQHLDTSRRLILIGRGGDLS